ncbi:rodlin [Streptomyces alkaliterrae]|uniref:RdlA protein n=1 Tax=Streptomyces alkaliterrae TaxID=2213162 RepID=A0A5P0YRF5_9ACTN|nr:rodlin [Streptomyces alkaliterrae]MBB1255104.1 RdlA protein [Streptomyces alkaliterrae]MBB1259547.1 RdlA protein [Streptomyces alkaliterrae]MQS02848.1 RdlA protein [Streptomyces alkaliterrae]
MIKKVFATAAVAASVVGAAGVAATPAMAIGDDGHTNVNGNGAKQVYGNTTTGGYMSPNMSLVDGTANKLCAAALTNKLNVGSVVGILVPVTVQDILTSSNAQNCAENSNQVDGDDPLSHVLERIEVVSRNGVANAG